ncbi:hypothetical protein [Atopobacter sp. AH10]|uniref:hypothetical protein n=1 Tax=Atopobacter sp. AH10 TaxID=2315861 RepID=UPI0013145C86|nr:hypothetical protein [Atopobacter sp. AH10]
MENSEEERLKKKLANKNIRKRYEILRPINENCIIKSCVSNDLRRKIWNVFGFVDLMGV